MPRSEVQKVWIIATRIKLLKGQIKTSHLATPRY